VVIVFVASIGIPVVNCSDNHFLSRFSVLGAVLYLLGCICLQEWQPSDAQPGNPLL
jgi:hypothetical protein